MDLNKISSKVVAAPMAATTNITFRRLCKKFGAGLTTSEMIFADLLVKGCTNTLRRVFFDEEDRPVSLQLFGNNPRTMAMAAKVLMKLKPDFIDINAGCPVPKINNLGCGAALLNDLNKLGEIVRAVVDAVDIPISVKIRTGYNKNKIVACEASKVIEDNGAAFVTVHARTRQTSYAEKPDWRWIEAVKKTVKIPVIGNGDVFKPKDAFDMLEQTGCDYVLIARGALGNPWIFNRALHYINHGIELPEPTYEEKLQLILSHIDMTYKEQGEINGVKEMRKHLCWYTRGFPGAAEFRDEIFSVQCPIMLNDILTRYFEKIISGQITGNENSELEELKFRERVLFWLVDLEPSQIING